jgi:hypothetical protein
MDIHNIFFIQVLQIFDYFLTNKEKYSVKRIVYSPIADDPYEIYYESLLSHSTGINFILYRFHLKHISPICIDISRPKSKLLNAFDIKYYGSGYDERKHFSIEEVVAKEKMQNFFKVQNLDGEIINNILSESINIMQQRLMPIIRGEKWIDEL